MTSSQYNNIIQGTLGTLPAAESADSVQVARAIMNNCGVALPTGNCTDILRTLISGYMGWKSCTKSEAQGYANAGIAAIGMDANRMLVVAPKEETIVVDSAMETSEEVSVYARTVSGISTDEQMTLQYFAYAGEDTTTITPVETFFGNYAGVPIYKVTDSSGTYLKYTTGMAICADGAPTAYHPTNDDLALDYLRNAGNPETNNWWGVACDENGNPYIQRNTDPAPGYYVSTTALSRPGFEERDPRRYYNSTTELYVVVPLDFLNSPYNVKKGNPCCVINKSNNRESGAIVAEVGPNNKLGEGSIWLAERLGVPSSAKHGGTSEDIVEYRVYL